MTDEFPTFADPAYARERAEEAAARRKKRRDAARAELSATGSVGAPVGRRKVFDFRFNPLQMLANFRVRRNVGNL